MRKLITKIRIFDNKKGREIVKNSLTIALNDTTNISGFGRRGEIIRESLLVGPKGILYMESIWRGTKLDSVILKGTVSRYNHFR